MNKKLQFDGPIRAAVIAQYGSARLDIVRSVLKPADLVDEMQPSDLPDAQDVDILFCAPICGSSPIPRYAAPAGIPAMAVEPSLVFHPYHAAFYRELEERGGIRLPADNPEEIAASIRAVRARKALRGVKLIAGVTGRAEDPHEDLRRFAAADRELESWYAEVFDGPGEMDPDHMRRVAGLYLAMRDLLEETGAAGITPDDIGGFLTIPEPVVMPNVAYGPLVKDGYLVCEEGDIDVLTSELLLYAGLGAHPTMSNIYFAYRDRFSALESYTQYTPEMEGEDCRQCFADNHVTAAHFSTSGVLPPGMMQEDRYRVREALPSWPGQSMIAATPKPGPVVMARLRHDAAAVHLVPGNADGLGLGDRYGWYRGRWFIRVPDAKSFAAHCLHQHYAIGPAPDGAATLDILCKRLLGLEAVAGA